MGRCVERTGADPFFYFRAVRSIGDSTAGGAGAGDCSQRPVSTRVGGPSRRSRDDQLGRRTGRVSRSSGRFGRHPRRRGGAGGRSRSALRSPRRDRHRRRSRGRSAHQTQQPTRSTTLDRGPRAVRTRRRCHRGRGAGGCARHPRGHRRSHQPISRPCRDHRGHGRQPPRPLGRRRRRRAKGPEPGSAPPSPADPAR